MIPRPKLSRTAERCDEAFSDDTGRRPVSPGSLSRVRENNPSLLDLQTSDRPPGDLGCNPLQEGPEECVLQIVLHWLKRHPYARDDALYKGPLLLEGLL